MKKSIQEELDFIVKQMFYNQSKTKFENQTRINEIFGPNPEGGDFGGSGGTGSSSRTSTGSSSSGTVRRSTPSYVIPNELKQAGGVLKFQQWLKDNNFGSELGPPGADGKYGRFTSSAWEKHGKEYLTDEPVTGGATPVDNTTPTPINPIDNTTVTDPNTNNTKVNPDQVTTPTAIP